MSSTNTRPRKLSYFLDWNPSKGHRLGINAIDTLTIGSDEFLLTAGRDSTVRLWDVASRRLLHTSLDHTDSVLDLAVIPGRSRVITCGTDTMVRMFDASATGLRLVEYHPLHTDSVTALGCDHSCIVSGSVDGRAVVCDPMLRPVSLLRAHDSIYSVGVWGSLLTLGTSSGRILVFDMRASTAPIMRLAAHTDVVRRLEINATSTTLLSCSSDGTVRNWDMRTSRCLITVRPHTDAVWAFATVNSPTASYPLIVSSGRDAVIMITHLTPCPTSRVLAVCASPVTDIALLHGKTSLWVTHTAPFIDNYEIEPTPSPDTSLTASPGKIGITLSEIEFAQTGAVSFDLTPRTVASLTPHFANAEQKALWCSSEVVPVTRSYVGTSEVAATATIDGGTPALVRCACLTNRRTVVVMSDSPDRPCSLWDVVTMKKKKDNVNVAGESWGDMVARLDAMCHKAASWCHVECKLGALCVTLSDTDTFSSELTFWEMDCALSAGMGALKSSRDVAKERREIVRSDDTVNLGCEVVSALSGGGGHYMIVTGNVSEKERVVSALAQDCFVMDQMKEPSDVASAMSIPSVFPTTLPLPGVIFDKGYGSEKLDLLRASDSKIPSWVSDSTRKFDTTKINLQLSPLEPKEMHSIPSANRLAAGKFLPIYKVAEYIAEKLRVAIANERFAEDIFEIVTVNESTGVATPVDPLISLNTIHKQLKTPQVLKLFYRKYVAGVKS